MKHFLNCNMLIVVCRMARVWLKIQWFCNFCKFTNKNIRLLFKYQGLQVECSTLLQKIQLNLLHRAPIDPPTLVPCRSLAFFVSDSVLFSARAIDLVVFFSKNQSLNSMYLYSLGAKERHITQLVQLWSIPGHHIEWQKLHLPCAKLCKKFLDTHIWIYILNFYIVNLQKWQNSLILKPSYQPLKAYKHLKNAS